MSSLENALFSCGILHPIQQLLGKQKDVNIWTIQMISLNAFANQTGAVLHYKAAIRRKHKLIHEKDENVCAQRYSSPESESETVEETLSGNSIYLSIT